MNCEEVKHYIELFMDSELDPKTNLEVSEHLSYCAKCNKRFAHEQEVENRIVSIFSEREDSAQDARDINQIWAGALSKINKQEKIPFRLRLRKRYLAPAFAGFMVALFLVIYAFPENNDLVAAASHCHSEYLDNKIVPTIETDVPKDITNYFANKFAFPITLPIEDQENSGSKLIGARLCYLKETAVAYVMYRYHNTPLSLFYIDKKDLSNFPKTKDLLAKQDCFERTNVNGSNLVAMNSEDTIVCAVSSLDVQLLRKVVNGCE
ncbi:MAG: anti-sigma factor family protein [Candidatus Anammoxibacter sp.]